MAIAKYDPPGWLKLLIGVAAIAIGASLTLKPFTSLRALAFFVAASLIVAGAGEFLAHRKGENPLRAWIVGGILVATGLVALVAPDRTIRLIAIIVGVGLVLSGLLKISSGLRPGDRDRFVPLVGGLATLIIGVLALSWRDITLLSSALLIGPVAVILGFGQIWDVISSLWTSDDDQATTHSSEQPRTGIRKWAAMGRAGLALVVALALIGVSSWLHENDREVDAFYDTPSSMPQTPGQLLDSEEFTRLIPDGASAQRILYTTTRYDGTIAAASGIVVMPETGSEPRNVLLWTHGTTGVVRECAPSIVDDPFGSGGMPALNEMMARGWVLVVPDYIGLGTEGPHPYLVGRPTAHSSLDAVRAARQLEGSNMSDRTVVWGHSQGGGAALWVGVEQATYAPDVPLAGVAALAPASDTSSLATGLTSGAVNQLFAVFTLEGYSSVYPDVNVADYINDEARASLDEVKERCLSERTTLASLASLLSGEELFKQSLTEGAMAQRLAENIPRFKTGIPTFIGQGQTDVVVLPDVQQAFVESICALGQDVEFHQIAGRDHMGIVAEDSPMIPNLLAWTDARFAGTQIEPGCSTVES